MNKYICLIITLLVSVSCSNAQKVDFYRFKILETYPHDITSYTQGLFFHNGELYESCGQYGESSMRKVDIKSGKAVQRVNFDGRYFLEGSCMINGKLFILTWREGVCFVCDPVTFKETARIPLRGEGWGLTTDGKQLIMSDGSSNIYFKDPRTFADTRTISVTKDGKPVTYLNELEYIDGKIWANVYGQDVIVMIDPKTGVVEGILDCRNILPRRDYTSRTDVLNGIAYNPDTKELYITGKYWPKMFKIKIEK
ncbi:MAG: glutaminyl-peptide cyclotransferase [Bacteroidales bacterium]|nr:glutaminyl-peptide cyclotransferase [Bacteroidales bacterium]